MASEAVGGQKGRLFLIKRVLYWVKFGGVDGRVGDFWVHRNVWNALGQPECVEVTIRAVREDEEDGE